RVLFRLAPADDPADLAVRVHALADERRLGAQDEVAGHALPDVVERVLVEPHVGARTRDGVRLLLGVINDRARVAHVADVRVGVEQAEGLGPGGDGGEAQGPEEGARAALHGRRGGGGTEAAGPWPSRVGSVHLHLRRNRVWRRTGQT